MRGTNLSDLLDNVVTVVKERGRVYMCMREFGTRISSVLTILALLFYLLLELMKGSEKLWITKTIIIWETAVSTFSKSAVLCPTYDSSRHVIPLPPK